MVCVSWCFLAPVQGWSVKCGLVALRPGAVVRRHLGYDSVHTSGSSELHLGTVRRL
jgi:hypothetical protein